MYRLRETARYIWRGMLPDKVLPLGLVAFALGVFIEGELAGDFPEHIHALGKWAFALSCIALLIGGIRQSYRDGNRRCE